MCKKCADSKEKFGVSDYSSENDGDPYPVEKGGFPHHLPKLTMIEEMLISPVHVMMKCYVLENVSRGYKGHVTNIAQDNQSIVLATSLPWPVENLPLFVARTSNGQVPMEEVQAFRTNRANMKRHLEF